jgi:hypothetical protein
MGACVVATELTSGVEARVQVHEAGAGRQVVYRLLPVGGHSVRREQREQVPQCGVGNHRPARANRGAAAQLHACAT